MNNPETSIVVLPRQIDSVKTNQPSQIPSKQSKAFLLLKARSNWRVTQPDLSLQTRPNITVAPPLRTE
jgi:hypothetical protein